MLVVHLIDDLGLGGAETMLFQIMKFRTDIGLQYKVISLGEAHYYEKAIQELGVQVIDISFRKHPLSSIPVIIKEIKDSDLLCCWMYHANLIGFFLGKIAKVKRIIWCIRHSSIDKKTDKPRTLMINKICARLSSKVDCVAFNGNAAKEAHESIGYSPKNGIVLRNGCDCSLFCPNPNAQKKMHNEFGISNDKRIILSVTRNHPIKDIPTFIMAISLLKKNNYNIVAIMCGSGVTDESVDILDLCKKNSLSIGTDIKLIGPRSDVQYMMAGCDMFVLHSAGEAFPNTLIQAMACGCMCVATDVGEVRKVLKNDSLIVKPGNASDLADKISEMISLSNEMSSIIRNQLRDRALCEYNIKNVVTEYERLFLR